MKDDNKETTLGSSEFDISSYPTNSLFHDRRSGAERRNGSKHGGMRQQTGSPAEKVERRVRKERRRRIDPTTFEKQYTDDEMEFMNAMQRFKELTGTAFPTHGEVLKVAVQLGYRKLLIDEDAARDFPDAEPPSALRTPAVDLRVCPDIAIRSRE
jgi:hypothetical protein